MNGSRVERQSRPDRRPWLVRRFVDPKANSSTSRAISNGVAEREGAIRTMSERRAWARRCRFLVREHHSQYGLARDPASSRLAKIVHAAAVASNLDARRSGAQGGSTRVLALHAERSQEIEHRIALYDALYAWCEERCVMGTREGPARCCRGGGAARGDEARGPRASSNRPRAPPKRGAPRLLEGLLRATRPGAGIQEAALASSWA